MNGAGGDSRRLRGGWSRLGRNSGRSCSGGFCRRLSVAVSTAILFDNYVNAFFVLRDYRQRPARCLQQSREFSFDKATLLLRIANMTERRTHIKSAA